MEGKIEEVIIDTIEEIKKENPDAEIDKIQSLVLEKIKENLRDKLELDLYETPDEVLWGEIEKDVQEKLGIFEELDDEIENEGRLDTIADLEKEIQRINELEEKGKSKQATVASGRIIRKIKDEIKKIKNAEEANSSDLDYLEKLEIALDEQLEWHKNQLSNRYKKEFSQKPATVKAIITALPKGIGIQAKKVVNCINQLKEAKTNKERIFKIIELGKEIGVLALTPVTFTVRFIVKHWYLLLLLLLLLRLPGFNFGKNPSEEHNPNLQPEEEYAYEPVTETGKEPVYEPGTETGKEPVYKPGTEPSLNPGQKPVPPVGVPDDQPEQNPGLNPSPVFADGNAPQTDTGSVEVEPVVPAAPVVEPVETPILTTDQFYETITKTIEEQNPGTVVYRTYQEAVESQLSTPGLTPSEADWVVQNNPHIQWIVGKGGVFETEEEMLRAYEQGQAGLDTSIEEYLSANDAQLQQMMSDPTFLSDPVGYLQGLPPALLFLFITYEALQYGLAVPTGGLSLLAPG